MLDQIVRLTARRPQPISAICNRLNLSEKALGKEISGAKKRGYTLTIVDGHVRSGAPVAPHGIPILGVAPRKGTRARVAVATDIHFGSAHCDTEALVEFLRIAWSRGARVAVCTGDLLDGNKPVLLQDQSHIGFDHQVDLAVATMAKAPPFEWVAIDGNHDGYFSASAGFVSGQIVEKRMRESGVSWTFAGVCLGRAIIHGARWHLWHPHGGASTRNAVRRVLNSRGEAISEACDVLAMGHLHKFVSLPIFPELVHGIAGGTFQRKASEFGNRIANAWDVGGTIVSYSSDRKGRIREISAEFISAGEGA